MTRLTIALMMAALLGFGCSDDDKASAPDISVSDFTTPVGDGAVACGTGVYPCGPYGTGEGDVVKNLSFMGFSDPKDLCKNHKDKVMDTTALRKISFADFHTGAAGCDANKPKVLWLVVSAGWCGPCRDEVKEIQGWYKANQVNERIALVNMLYETASPVKPADETFIKKWISTYNLSLPVVMDPSFKMGTFFSRKAVPFNILIDTKTMKVLYREAGRNTIGMGKKALDYINTL